MFPEVARRTATHGGGQRASRVHQLPPATPTPALVRLQSSKAARSPGSSSQPATTAAGSFPPAAAIAVRPARSSTGEPSEATRPPPSRARIAVLCPAVIIAVLCSAAITASAGSAASGAQSMAARSAFTRWRSCSSRGAAGALGDGDGGSGGDGDGDGDSVDGGADVVAEDDVAGRGGISDVVGDVAADGGILDVGADGGGAVLRRSAVGESPAAVGTSVPAGTALSDDPARTDADEDDEAGAPGTAGVTRGVLEPSVALRAAPPVDGGSLGTGLLPSRVQPVPVAGTSADDDPREVCVVGDSVTPSRRGSAVGVTGRATARPPISRAASVTGSTRLRRTNDARTRSGARAVHRRTVPRVSAARRRAENGGPAGAWCTGKPHVAAEHEE
jgi:hypothetical protein